MTKQTEATTPEAAQECGGPFVPLVSGFFSDDDVTKEMENAGMAEARWQLGLGITRTAARKIFLAMINAR
jgi:hypothetical protein